MHAMPAFDGVSGAEVAFSEAVVESSGVSEVAGTSLSSFNWSVSRISRGRSYTGAVLAVK